MNYIFGVETSNRLLCPASGDINRVTNFREARASIKREVSALVSYHMATFDGSGVELSLDKLTFDLKSSPTPIKVRGRNGRKPIIGLSPKVKAKRVANSLLTPESTTASAKHELGKRSRLEQLPFDIIERIFLECLNVHLPRAAPLIGATLSTPHTYNEFCRRAFCLPVNGPVAALPPILPPVTLQRIQNRQKLIEQDRRLTNVNRSLALQSVWATWGFFHSFQEQVVKSEELWFGKFTCEIPSKLLKRSWSESERHFFLALVTAGAAIDPDSVEFELVSDVWKGALEEYDLQVLECLVERHIGRIPTREERVEAIDQSDYNIETLRILRHLRLIDDKRERKAHKEKRLHWPDDWPQDWPESDAEVMANTMDRYDADHQGISQMLAQNPRGRSGVIRRKLEEHAQLVGKIDCTRLPWKTRF